MGAGVEGAFDHPGFGGGDAYDGGDLTGGDGGDEFVHAGVGDVAVFGVDAEPVWRWVGAGEGAGEVCAGEHLPDAEGGGGGGFAEGELEAVGGLHCGWFGLRHDDDDDDNSLIRASVREREREREVGCVVYEV